MTQRGKLSRVAVAVSLTATAMFLTGPPWASATPNPPGNNTTVKIDGTPSIEPIPTKASMSS
jgi:hypothetical protein